MTYCQNTINEMVSIILTKKLPYENTIIIGNNSSGKSELLKRLLLKSASSYNKELIMNVCVRNVIKNWKRWGTASLSGVENFLWANIC